MADIITVDGYDIVGHVVTDDGRVLLLNNNCDHYIVARQVALGDAEHFEPTARVLGSFLYRVHDEGIRALRSALDLMTEAAIAGCESVRCDCAACEEARHA